MTSDNWPRLVALLSRRAAADKIEWEHIGGDVFDANFAKQYIRLEKTSQGNFRIRVYDLDGAQLDGILIRKQSPFFEEVDNLWGLARRQALGLDQKWNELFSELEDES